MKRPSDEQLQKLNYVRSEAEKTFCPECNKNLTRVGPDLDVYERFASIVTCGLPMFYICWDCNIIIHCGHGRVKESSDETDTDS